MRLIPLFMINKADQPLFYKGFLNDCNYRYAGNDLWYNEAVIAVRMAWRRRLSWT